MPPTLWRSVSGVRVLRVESGPSRTVRATNPTMITVMIANPVNTGPRPTSASMIASGVDAMKTDAVPGRA